MELFIPGYERNLTRQHLFLCRGPCGYPREASEWATR